MNLLKTIDVSGKDDFEGFIKYVSNEPKLKKSKFFEYSPVYTFTTENLDSYLNAIDIFDKKVLTVTSSGVHLINLSLLGAKKIDCFDINKLCYYYTKLKIAFILNCNYIEFLQYFTYCEDSIILSEQLYPLGVMKNCYDYNLYLKVRDKLELDVQLFFDLLYKKYEYSGRIISESNIFYNIDISSAIFRNSYLGSIENYYLTRIKLKKMLQENKINFFNLDVQEIHNLDGKYDVVLLSNIYDYIPESLKNLYIQYIEYDMSKILEENAKVLVSYKYCSDERKEHDTIVKNLAIYIDSIKGDKNYKLGLGENMYDGLDLSVIKVPTIYEKYREYNREDCVYVYKKK